MTSPEMPETASEIEREAELSRARLAATLDQLRNHLTPQHIADELLGIVVVEVDLLAGGFAEMFLGELDKHGRISLLEMWNGLSTRHRLRVMVSTSECSSTFHMRLFQFVAVRFTFALA